MTEKERAEILKALRNEHQQTVENAQAYLKDQQAVRKAIRKSLQGGAKTVPEVAVETSLESHLVMWHMMAMKKFDLIEELDLDGEYYRYQLTQEKSK